jgi:hypothetical protein
MNTNQEFAVFCTKKCLHLWDPPQEVLDWLTNPENKEKAEAAEVAAWAAGTAARAAALAAARAAGTAAEAAYWAARAAWAAAARAARAAWVAAEAAYWAAQALDTTETELKFEFVSTWTDEQLSTIDPEWIEYTAVEIMNREH